jgi:hypothetical protein
MGWTSRGGAALAAALLSAGCAAGGKVATAPARIEPPLTGPAAFGVEFGAERAAVEARLSQAGVAAQPDPGDQDALRLERCPGAPAAAPCRLLFGPAGLYALEQDVPAAQADELVSAAGRWLGAPRRPQGKDQAVLAAWEPPGWTVAVARHAQLTPPVATLRAEWDEATPPLVSGVPLGRRRGDVELVLRLQGATLIQQDDESTSYLGCPLGDGDAVSCTITWRQGRAAAVTELWPASGDDQAAMDAWKARADAMEKEIGRPPQRVCPSGGPERVGGDCTASWSSDRLLVVVGAHRSPGGQHRGPIAVYVGYAYPPLGRDDGD